MHVITGKRLNEFAERYPETRNALAAWYRSMKSKEFSSIEEIRTVSHRRQGGKLTVFTIGGNKARLVAAIHYNRGKIYIRAVLTHKEYDEGQWKE